MERASRLGVLGGGVVSLAAIVGYYFVPLVTTVAYHSLNGIATVGAETLSTSSVVYHLWVLVLPSFLITIGSILLIRHRGVHARTDDYRVIGGIVVTPLAIAVVLYFLGALVVAGSFAGPIVLAYPGAEWPPFNSLENVLGFLLGIVGLFMLLFLIFGLAFFIGSEVLIADVFPVFILAIGTGAVGGYLVAQVVTIVISRYSGDIRG